MEKILTNDLSNHAYRQVKAMIITKKLAPGQKIVQDKLAEDLGISRTPLRSALQILEGEGLIESVPRKGVIVKEFTNKELVEIFDCRRALEGTAIRSFTARATDKEITELKKIFQPFLSGDIDASKYQLADMKFHNTIMKNCGNAFLNKLYGQANLLFSMDVIGLLRCPSETLPEHLDIISAIENRDLDLTESLAKLHLDKTKELILKKL